MLAARLMEALQKLQPDVAFIGVAGPQMRAAGCICLVPMEELAVMGAVEVLRYLPRILSAKRKIIHYFKKNPPSAFIGIDYPGFNLILERVFKKQGIPTFHYNSPSIWAWRKYRIYKIAKAVDLMLGIFPFGADIYAAHQVPFQFIGHPLADEIPRVANKSQYKQQLGYDTNALLVAILPGSRSSEIHYLGQRFIAAAKWCYQRDNRLQFIIPAVNETAKLQLTKLAQTIAPELPLRIVLQQSQAILLAADVGLIASGTATLEAMLCKVPMVVAYYLNPISYWIARALIHIPYFSLPNLLANKKIVPELLQQQVTPQNLGQNLLDWFASPQKMQETKAIFDELHQLLQKNAGETAAQAIAQFLRAQ